MCQCMEQSNTSVVNFFFFLRGCSAKRRRLMLEAEVDISENSNTSTPHEWPPARSCPPLSSQQASPAPPQPCTATQSLTLPQPITLPQPSNLSLSRPETEGSCMEVEAAQRKLQEIEDRCAKCVVCGKSCRNRLKMLVANVNIQ